MPPKRRAILPMAEAPLPPIFTLRTPFTCFPLHTLRSLTARTPVHISIAPEPTALHSHPTADEEAAEDEDEADDFAFDIQGITMGAFENNFLQRGNTFDVLLNVEGGVEDKGVSFTLTPMKVCVWGP